MSQVGIHQIEQWINACDESPELVRASYFYHRMRDNAIANTTHLASLSRRMNIPLDEIKARVEKVIETAGNAMN